MLNNNSILYNQPADIKINLNNHQLAMLHKCLEIEKNSNIGIMRDKPGSGKTYVILALINELKKKSKNIESNIIIVPQNIYYQWVLSIENFSSELVYDKFINYDNILDLYVNPEKLKDKDIILTTSSYYYTIASTFKSLKINVKRIFIDEIDSISNLINMDINANFIMFVSASFDIENNGYFTDKIKNNNIDEITCVCEESFIDENIVLEEPNKFEYICKSIFIDKILQNVISLEEMRNINAMEYKLNNKKFDRCVAKDEKDFMNILINGNKGEIEKENNEIENMKKKKDFFIDIKKKKENIFNEFKINLEKIDIIKNYKKIILNLINNFNEDLEFFSDPKIDDQYDDIKDIIIKRRKNILKNVISIFNDYVEILYNFNFNDLKKLNLENLKNIFEKLLNYYDIIDENINKIKKEYDKIELKIENLDNLFEYHINFNDYIKKFNSNINDIKYFYDCDKQIDYNTKGIKELKESINYNEKKIDLIYDRFKENNICPICYDIFSDKIYVTVKCCNNKVCGSCTEKWHKKHHSCIYCNTDRINIKDLFLIENKENDNIGNDNIVNNNICNDNIGNDNIGNDNKEKNNYGNKKIYNFDKLTFLRDFIKKLSNDSNRKVIIFSDYNNIFSKITEACKDFDVKYSDLDKGNMKEIEEQVINYKYGESNILLANSTLFGCGMNLENSSDIIFVHKMNEKMENQVIGRAQRLGRKGVLNIIYLEYENEMVKETNKISINNFEEIEDLCNTKKNNIEISNNILSFDYQFSNNLNLLDNNELDDSNLSINNDIEISDNIINIQNNENINLPKYDEIIDVNLEELIQNLT